MQLNRGHSRETDRQADRQDTPPTCPLFLQCFNAVCISNYSQPHTLKLTHRIYCHTSLLSSPSLLSLSLTHTHTIMTGSVKPIQEVHIYACEHAHTRRRTGDLNDSQLLYISRWISFPVLKPTTKITDPGGSTNADGGLTVAFATEIELYSSCWRHY